MEMCFIKLVSSIFTHFLVADWTAVLEWLTTHTLHLHIFHSNLLNTFKHALYFNNDVSSVFCPFSL